MNPGLAYGMTSGNGSFREEAHAFEVEYRQITGNDHHEQCRTTVLAVCGLKTVQYVGDMGPTGELVDGRITISDQRATLYRALGVDQAKTYVVQG